MYVTKTFVAKMNAKLSSSCKQQLSACNMEVRGRVGFRELNMRHEGVHTGKKIYLVCVCVCVCKVTLLLLCIATHM